MINLRLLSRGICSRRSVGIRLKATAAATEHKIRHRLVLDI